VQEMLSCGLVALLRTALDEREESVVFAATHCLASLIAPQVSIDRLLYSRSFKFSPRRKPCQVFLLLDREADPLSLH
jgi:hypothetical protein